MNNQIFTLPNIISLSRLILAWPIAYYIFHDRLMITAILGLVAIATDFLDGYLSRTLNQASDAGKVIDPIVDSILVLAVLVALSIRQMIPSWYMQLIICRYGIITAMLSYYRYQSKTIPGSIPSGKWSMCAIATTITLSLFQSSYQTLFQVSISISTLLLILSLFDYFRVYLYAKS